MIDAGQTKALMPTRETLVRSFMGGALLSLAAAFAVTMTVQTGSALIGAMLFPVGFCMLYLLGYDLLTAAFVLGPMAWIDRRPGVNVRTVLRNWGLVFCGNFAGAAVVALLMAIVVTNGFATDPDAVGRVIGEIGEGRTVGYAEFGAAGMLTLFVRAVLCNWMVSTGVAGAFVSKDVIGKVIAMWMPIMLFFAMEFEHSIVNMFLFPAGLLLGGDFTVMDYLVWNEIPTVIGNLIGGLTFTGLMLYLAHRRSTRRRDPAAGPTPGSATSGGEHATRHAGTAHS